MFQILTDLLVCVYEFNIGNNEFPYPNLISHSLYQTLVNRSRFITSKIVTSKIVIRRGEQIVQSMTMEKIVVIKWEDQMRMRNLTH